MQQLTTFLQKEISLAHLDLFILNIPRKEVFVSGIGKRVHKVALIVKWTDKAGNVGYGECSCRPDPYFSAEFAEGAKMTIEQFIAPHLKSTQTYGQVLEVLSRVRGWNFTKAAVEYAMHDLIAKRDGETLFDHWGRKPVNNVPIGISIGILPDLATYEQTIKKSIKDGFRRLKFKISPGFPIEVADLMYSYRDQTYMSFDANGTFHEKDLDTLAQFLRFDHAIEQPFPPHRYDILKQAKTRFPDLKICFDEEVTGLGDLIKLHALEVIDELNIKPGRVGGLYQSIQIAEYGFQNDIPCWVGGMFETGIGRAFNLQVAAHLPDAVAHDLSSTSRYFAKGIVEQPLVMDQEGYVSLDQAQQVQVNEAAFSGFVVESSRVTS